MAEFGMSVTVLIAEDEFLIRFDLAEEMRLAGWTVVEVATADEAIVALSSPIPIDIVVTDVNMPGRATGLDLAAVTRRERPATKIVVMSGMPQLAAEPFLFDAFYIKPFTGPVLVERLRAMMQAKKLQSASPLSLIDSSRYDADVPGGSGESYRKLPHANDAE